MTNLKTADALPPFDELHRRARAAFAARDLNGYMDLFAAELRYRQPDGRVISRDRLTRDVAFQLRNLSALDCAYHTDAVTSEADQVDETLTTRASYATTIFFLIHRRFRLERQSRYTWRRTTDGWKIFEVEVLSETNVGDGFQIGRSPRLRPLT